MTSKECPVSVLFMDDEVYDENVLAVASAVAALRQSGYDVTVADTMTKAIDAFFEKFYKVFVLDIDMSHVQDALSGAGERGTRVAEIYRALDRGAQVVMYSAMGRAEDWFRVANRHVFGYVDKGARNAIPMLVEMVRAAAAAEPVGLRVPAPRESGSVLVSGPLGQQIDGELLIEIVRCAGVFEPVSCPLEEVPARLKSQEFAVVLLVAERFETVPPVPALIREICGVAPVPHTVIACEARDECLASLLSLVNAHPFRLVDLLAADWRDSLSRAIRAAAACHGGDEIFEAEPELVARAVARVDWSKMDQVLESGSEHDPEDAVAPGAPPEKR